MRTFTREQEREAQTALKMLGWLTLVAVVIVAVSAYAGTAPDPFKSGDVNQATVNAVGGVGRTVGWTYSASSASMDDLLSSTFMPTAFRAELTSPAVTSVTRHVTARLLCNDTANTCAAPADTVLDATCVRLGPDTTASSYAALTCTNPMFAGTGENGGCILRNPGDRCEYTLRPITSSCTTYTACHVPLWATSATAVAYLVEVTVSW